MGGLRRARRRRCIRGRAAAGDLTESGYLDALAAERTIEAEGRAENLEELIGVAAEFDANREVEGESDVRPLEEFLAQISLYTDQDSLADGESLCTLMTLHNAKGLEYERGVHDRLRGGGLSAHALARGGKPRGGAAPLLRGRHPGAPAPVHELRAAANPARWPRLQPARRGSSPRSRSSTSTVRTSTSPTGWPGAALGGMGTGAPERRQPHATPLDFAVGDDVVHASFGEGVVIGVESGQRAGRPVRRRRDRAQADG